MQEVGLYETFCSGIKRIEKERSMSNMKLGATEILPAVKLDNLKRTKLGYIGVS